MELYQRHGSDTSVLCGDFFLDVGHANFKLEALVDFVLLELGQPGVEAINFSRKLGLDAVDLCVELVDALVQPGDVVFGRHMLDDMRQHISKFVEGCFLSCHTWEVYTSLRERTRTAPTLRGEAVERPYARPGRHTIIDRVD
jgi:hypothetical protein